MCFSCSGDDANGGCFFEECGEVETMCGWRDLIEIDLDSTEYTRHLPLYSLGREGIAGTSYIVGGSLTLFWGCSRGTCDCW